MSPEIQAQIEAVRTAAVAANILTLELRALIQELRDVKNDLTCELLAVRDLRVAEHMEWGAFMGEIRGELTRIKAEFRIDATLLHLIQPPRAGELEHETEKGSQGGRGAQRTDTEARGDVSY